MRRWIGFYLRYISDGIKKDLNNIFSKYDITCQQGQMLLYLMFHEKENINQKTIEETHNLKSSTVSGILKRLEAKGLIERIVFNDDNRFKVIKATPKAYELKDILDRNREKVRFELTQGLSEDEEETLMRLLEIVAKNTDNLERNLK